MISGTSEKRLKAIFNSTLDGIILINQRGVMEEVNPATCRIFGYDADELLGKNVRILMPEPDRGRHDQYINNYLNTNVAKIIGIGREVQGLRKDDTRFPFWLSITEMTVDTERYFIGIVHDVSDLSEAKMKMDEFSEELKKTTEELQNFAYISSHDLQEPLRKIRTFSQRLIEKEKDNLSEKSTDYLQRMSNAADRMQRLIDNLLNFSRLTTHAKPSEKVDLNVILQEAIGDLEMKIKESSASIESDDLPVVEGDPVQLSQVFVNLIDNSIKYGPTEGQPRIQLRYQRLEDDVYAHKISFTDNGIGFDQKYVDRIFMIFQRLDPQHKGTGMGLAIVKKIIERHHGKIEAIGEQGSGATFVIFLP